jgi:F5/8 type C domain
MNSTVPRVGAIAFLLASLAVFKTAAACDKAIPIGGGQLSASNTYPGNPVSYLIDGNVENAWGAGGFASQWVQVDLGSVRPVCQLRLTVAQSPAGVATHTILVGDTEQTLAPLKSISQWFTDRQVVTIPLSVNTRVIRIRTDSSPSWVAWREMQVLSGQSARANNQDLRYAGYFSDGGLDELPNPNPNVAQPREYNVTAAVADSSNVAWTVVRQIPNKIGELRGLSRNDTKLIAVLGDVFFHPTMSYQKAWEFFEMDVILAKYGARIAAVTIADEPDGFNATQLVGFNDKLGFLRARIAASGHNIAVLINYSYLAFRTGNWYGLQFADWIGFDCYPQEQGSTDVLRYNQCTKKNATEYYLISEYVDMLVQMTANTSQRIMLFPQTFYKASPPTIGTVVPSDDKDFISAAYDNMLLIAENEPKVIGLTNFMYQSLDKPGSTDKWMGAEWLTDPDPLSGRDIKAKAQAVGRWSNMPTTSTAPD